MNRKYFSASLLLFFLLLVMPFSLGGCSKDSRNVLSKGTEPDQRAG